MDISQSRNEHVDPFKVFASQSMNLLYNTMNPLRANINYGFCSKWPYFKKKKKDHHNNSNKGPVISANFPSELEKWQPDVPLCSCLQSIIISSGNLYGKLTREWGGGKRPLKESCRCSGFPDHSMENLCFNWLNGGCRGDRHEFHSSQGSGQTEKAESCRSFLCGSAG